MAVEGVIADRTRALLGVTWDALLSDTQRYGEDPLGYAVELAKEDVLGIIPSQAEEEALPRIVVDFVAKVAAVQIIPGAIDFWMNHSLEETTRQPDETITYTDRAEMLRKLKEDLDKEIRARAAEIAGIVGYRRSTGRSVPAINTMNDEFLTPSPQEFPRPFAPTGRS